MNWLLTLNGVLRSMIYGSHATISYVAAASNSVQSKDQIITSLSTIRFYVLNSRLTNALFLCEKRYLLSPNSVFYISIYPQQNSRIVCHFSNLLIFEISLRFVMNPFYDGSHAMNAAHTGLWLNVKAKKYQRETSKP